ncbi:MerR family transcriptional regulator [Bacillus sp. SD075]|uniref:MerR family transcriptional regulator n=1 Tax=Bacillus sp. SD075 TaxID=2781732 RepID=UPI001A96A098|nr:MerR family transcriptional regulator [Bacillus sp. SD075]MBO0996781.1 MerR family transcriptional regulator [Bacillus sp. SD075]
MEAYHKVDEVAKVLGVTPSAVKKYYLMFEEQNYKFKRSNQGRLMFSEKDIDLFNKLIELKNEPGMKVHNAVKQLIKDNENDVSNVYQLVSNMMAEITNLKNLIRQQRKIINDQQEKLKIIDDKYGTLTKMVMEQEKRISQTLVISDQELESSIKEVKEVIGYQLEELEGKLKHSFKKS